MPAIGLIARRARGNSRAEIDEGLPRKMTHHVRRATAADHDRFQRGRNIVGDLDELGDLFAINEQRADAGVNEEVGQSCGL